MHLGWGKISKNLFSRIETLVACVLALVMAETRKLRYKRRVAKGVELLDFFLKSITDLGVSRTMA